MNKCPAEVLVYLLPYLGGHGFVALRGSCWRLKDICDQAEVSVKPILWYRYIFQEYPCAILESAAQDLYEHKPQDEAWWKQLYIRLTKIRSLRRGGKFVTKYLLSKSHFRCFNVIFMRGELFLLNMRKRLELSAAVGQSFQSLLDPEDSRSTRSQMMLELAPVPFGSAEFESSFNCRDKFILKTLLDFPASVDSVSTWANYAIMYSRYTHWETRELDIINIQGVPSNEREAHQKTLILQAPVRGISQIVFNSSQVVVLLRDCIHVYDTQRTCETYSPLIKQVPNDTTAVKMLGDLIIILYNGRLASSTVVRNDEQGMSVMDFRYLPLEKDCFETGLMPYKIMRFTLQGQIFAALTDMGRVYISILDSCDSDSLRNNLLEPYHLNFTPPIRMPKIAIDDSYDGVRLAVFESKQSTDPEDKLHMLHYVPKRLASSRRK